MENLDHERLKGQILDILREYPLGISEYELMRRLSEVSTLFHKNYGGDNLRLFRSHFILFNALYRIRTELQAESLSTVEIGALNIKIRSIENDDKNNYLAPSDDSKLESYYLDIKNLDKTGIEDINSLLDDFWKAYLAQEHKATALDELDLPPDASWDDIKRKFRELAVTYHPDKGGCRKKFQKISGARDVLAVCFGKQKKRIS